MYEIIFTTPKKDRRPFVILIVDRDRWISRTFPGKKNTNCELLEKAKEKYHYSTRSFLPSLNNNNPIAILGGLHTLLVSTGHCVSTAGCAFQLK